MMYFFRVEISLFDEEKETIFLIPDTKTLEKDEQPLFSEDALTAHPTFTAFLKRTKTAIVDVAYELYETKEAKIETMDAEKFEELLEQNKLELLDGNDFCIQTGKIKNHHKKGKSIFPKIGIAAAVLLLIVGAVAKKMRSEPQPQPEPTSEVTSGVVYSSENLQSIPEITEYTSVAVSSISSAQSAPSSSAISQTSKPTSTPISTSRTTSKPAAISTTVVSSKPTPTSSSSASAQHPVQSSVEVPIDTTGSR